jgi:hypothetical protein
MLKHVFQKTKATWKLQYLSEQASLSMPFSLDQLTGLKKSKRHDSTILHRNRGIWLHGVCTPQT